MDVPSVRAEAREAVMQTHVLDRRLANAPPHVVVAHAVRRRTS